MRIQTSIANPVVVVLWLKTDRTDVFRCKGYIFMKFIISVSLMCDTQRSSSVSDHKHNKQLAKITLGVKDDGVAVASAQPYANHLHLAPDR